MPLNLPDMAAQWEIIPSKASLVGPGLKRAAEQNAKRLAIGFSHAGGLTAAVFPLITNANQFRFFLVGNSTVWLYWQKHGPIVGMPWIFSTTNLAGDEIEVVEIFQAGSKK